MVCVEYKMLLTFFFSPSISCPTVREKCLLGVSDAQPVRSISCQLLTCWFLEVTCLSALVQLLFEGDPGHTCGRSSSAQNRTSSVTLLLVLFWLLKWLFFFFCLLPTSSKRTIATNPQKNSNPCSLFIARICRFAKYSFPCTATVIFPFLLHCPFF